MIALFFLLLLPAGNAFTPLNRNIHASSLVIPRLASTTPEDAVKQESSYHTMIEDLATLLDDTSQKLQAIKDIAGEIEALEIRDPKAITDVGPKIPQDLAQALAEAKAADDIFGPRSPESSQAWNEAEEISMGDLSEKQAAHHPTYRYRNAAHQNEQNHHWYAAIVDPQSLHQAVDAIGKIEHLSRLVSMERSRLIGTEEEGGLSP